MRKFLCYGCVALLIWAGVSLGQTDSDKLLQFLDHSVDWYQRVVTMDPAPINAQELLLRQTVREAARQAITTGFDFAHAEAGVLSRTERRPATQKTSAAAAQLPQRMAANDALILQLQSQLADANARRRNAPPSEDALARAKESKLQAQLDLAEAQSSVLHNYAEFLSAGTTGSISILDHINDLQRTVPETGTDATTRPSVPTPLIAREGGLISLISELFELTNRMTALTRLADQAAALEKQSDNLHEPIRAQIMEVMRHGSDLSNTTQPTTSPGDLNAQRDQIDIMTTTIKEMSRVGLALSQQRIDLEAARQGLLSWRAVIAQQYTADIRSVLVRVVGTALVVVLIMIISEFWKRATYKYVHDTRRRRGLMLVRRIVIGCIFGVIIIASVVTEFGSLATFAGLITAGIAVSLQTVILSGVAYFFFIGRYGVRVGDRVTINGITGDVVEVGLFRLYLMELGGQKGDLHATGRMIVFSNAVVFQPQAFYKQLPGTAYVWHEVGMTLSRDGDHVLAEKRLMAAVQGVFQEYQDTINSQHDFAMRTLHVTLDTPRPEGRLRFVESGIQFVIRYPVELDRASAIDDQITRAVLQAIDDEPKLKLSATGTPQIQTVT